MSETRKKVPAAKVREEILPGASEALLKELHLLTRDGDLNADARRKVKQINHLIGLLRPGLTDVLERFTDPVIVDCGAGKSYLGFLIAQLVLAPAGKGRVVAVESRPELAAATNERAARLALPQVEAIAATVDRAPIPERVHLVTALHACDTATDDALLPALRHNADWIAVVPCCQAEVAQQLKAAKPTDDVIAALARHGIHRREIGSHLTNVIRALVLESRGYQVTVTELVGMEHSLKNELILAKRIQRFDAEAKARLDALLTRSGVHPKLIRDLEVPSTRS